MPIIENFPIIHPGNGDVKYRIVLFQGGLGDQSIDGRTYFSETVRKIISRSTDDYSPKIINNYLDSSTEFIDMSDFYVSNKCFRDDNKKRLFDLKISNIYNLAKDNPSKTLLVRTFLNMIYDSNIYYDSIENQKTKLIYIIDALKQYENVEIFLVGHSQGGLVNLEAAIERNEDIDRMISISTPYAPVDYAYFYSMSLIGNELLEYGKYLLAIENNAVLLTKKRQCVEVLASADYYTNLKNKWNALSPRPKLTVITGTAGRICEAAVPNSYTPEECEGAAFDGLVMLTDQKDISYATKINLVDTNVPCYDVWNKAWLNCVTSTNCADTCSGNCTLETHSITKLFFDYLGAAVEELISVERWSEEEFNVFTNNPLFRVIQEGLNSNINFNCPDGYEDYYRIALNPYNHKHIMYNDETIELLFNLLTAY